MNETLFVLAALPAILGIAIGAICGLIIQHKLDNNIEFRKKWSGWGGKDFWIDAKKINDPILQKFICFFETWCARSVVIGFFATIILETCFFLYVK